MFSSFSYAFRPSLIIILHMDLKIKKKECYTSSLFNFLPESPARSILRRFLASSIVTVNLPAVGTYRSEKQISPY